MATIATQEMSELLLQAEQRLRGSTSTTTPQENAVIKTAPVTQVVAPMCDIKGVSGRIARKDSKIASAVKDSAGAGWFDLPKTVPTPEFRRDWQVLRMRGLLDPKHQKKTLRAQAPKYSHVGNIVEGPADFFSGRLARKERRQTILGEVMRDHSSDKLRSKYGAIQEKKASGKKAFYQKSVAQRRKGRG